MHEVFLSSVSQERVVAVADVVVVAVGVLAIIVVVDLVPHSLPFLQADDD